MTTPHEKKCINPDAPCHAPTPSVNYLQVGDKAHCFTCHVDFDIAHIRSHPHFSVPGESNPTSCTSKCGQWFIPKTPTPETQLECSHSRIHTERLFLSPEKEKPLQHVIDSLCADCGLFLKSVKIHAPEKIDTTPEAMPTETKTFDLEKFLGDAKKAGEILKRKESTEVWEKMEMWFSQNYNDPDLEGWEPLWNATRLHFEKFLAQARTEAKKEERERIMEKIEKLRVTYGAEMQFGLSSDGFKNIILEALKEKQP